jgi:hypothetical protein
MKKKDNPIYKINEISKEVENTLQSYKPFIDEMMDKITKMSQIFSESLSNIKIPNINLNTDTILNIQYIMLMHKIQYPLFLETDEEFKKEVVKHENDIKEVEIVIENYLNDEYLKSMLKEWETSNCINKDRLPILKEAIELHLKKYYFACTSMMMCQLYGIVIDIYHYLRKMDVEISEESKNDLAKEYQIEKIDSEKGRLIQLAFIPEGGHLIKEAIVDYFQKEILSSSEKQERWRHQPLRNKICHGDQLNYGTKEHSLKAIMCINLLFKLGEDIKIAIENISDDVDTK